MDPMISALPMIAARLAALEGQVEELLKYQHRISSRTYSLESLQAEAAQADSTSDLKADAIALHERGTLPKNIARRLRVNETMVRRWLNEAGLIANRRNVFVTCRGMDQSPDVGGAA